MVINYNLLCKFYSYPSKDNNQDPPGTHDNMMYIYQKIMDEYIINIWKKTYGCENQYSCELAVYLVAITLSKLKIIMDREIGAPGHGKDVIYVPNTRDKRHLR